MARELYGCRLFRMKVCTNPNRLINTREMMPVVANILRRSIYSMFGILVLKAIYIRIAPIMGAMKAYLLNMLCAWEIGSFFLKVLKNVYIVEITSIMPEIQMDIKLKIERIKLELSVPVKGLSN